MIDDQTVQTLLAILKNPIVLGAIIAVIRNLGGYIYNCIEAHKLLQYKAGDFLVTLGLWETFFVSLGTVAGLPISWVASITTIVDIVRGFRQAVTQK